MLHKHLIAVATSLAAAIQIPSLPSTWGWSASRKTRKQSKARARSMRAKQAKKQQRNRVR
jgi:hypothetical protein